MLSMLSTPHRRHLALTFAVAAGLAAYLVGSLDRVLGFDLALLLALVGGFPIYLTSLRALLRGKLTADLAVTIAAIAALVIGEYAVAAEVILIMLIGEGLEHYAVGRTRSGIAALLELRPETARIRRGSDERIVPTDEILHDDVVCLKPGDRVPVDGRVIRGSSSVDESPITGESLPADKAEGDEVFAGTINLHGTLEVHAERLGGSTTLERIIHLVEHAEASRAPAQRLADRYATYFVPIVLVLSLGVYLLTGDPLRSVAVLVVACPCALVLATPTAIAAALGGLVRHGILVKGGNALEALGRVRSVVFDKTGTLTLARLRVARVVAALESSESEVLRFAAAVETSSEHPLAGLVVEEAHRRSIEIVPAEGFVARPGLGAEGFAEGSPLRVGNARFLRESDALIPEEIEAALTRLEGEGCTVILVSKDDRVVGVIGVEDTPRPEAEHAISDLRRLGIERITMLTGDHEAAARAVARGLRIADVQSGLLPDQKVESIRRIGTEAGPVAMVGDGINDAPSLITADVGIAMADIGSDIAIESADVVLVGGDLRKVALAVETGREMLRIIWQNIIGFALVFNALCVAAASAGWISPIGAAVVHQVSSLTVVLNSLRLLVDRHAWVRRFETTRRWVVENRRRLAYGGIAALLTLYGLSGIHSVGVGEVAVVQRFGRVVDAAEPPGLHYRLPWPLGAHTRVRIRQLYRVEIGFRTVLGASAEPAAYEWNIQHRGGRTERKPEEATILTGDESLVDVNVVVQYRVQDPVLAVFALGTDGPGGESKWDGLVRRVVEAALREDTSSRPVDALLASERKAIEVAVRTRAENRLRASETGLSLVAVRLADVHPPLDVVPSYREVTSAREEKEARINNAEAYRSETEALARGKAQARKELAEASASDRSERARGRAARFSELSAAFSEGPAVTRLRLYLETVERVLAGKRKVIVDAEQSGVRRQIFLGRSRLWPVAGTPVEAPDEEGENLPQRRRDAEYERE